MLQELVTEFLKSTVGAMTAALEGSALLDPTALGMLQAQALGVSGVVRKAGKGILTVEGVQEVMAIIAELLRRISTAEDLDQAAGAAEEDGEGSEAEDGVTRQMVRLSLADAAGALMRANRDQFVAVALPTTVVRLGRTQ